MWWNSHASLVMMLSLFASLSILLTIRILNNRKKSNSKLSYASCFWWCCCQPSRFVGSLSQTKTTVSQYHTQAASQGIDTNSEDFRRLKEFEAQTAARSKRGNPLAPGGESEEEQPPYAGQTLNFTALIHKPNINKTLTFELLSAEGTLYCNGVQVWETGQLPFQESAESEVKRAHEYNGPMIADLPAVSVCFLLVSIVSFDSESIDRLLSTMPHFTKQDVREELMQYLAARGINDDMAAFVLEYTWFKEQKEYVRFLTGLHGFLSH